MAVLPTAAIVELEGLGLFPTKLPAYVLVEVRGSDLDPLRCSEDGFLRLDRSEGFRAWAMLACSRKFPSKHSTCVSSDNIQPLSKVQYIFLYTLLK